MRVIFSGGDSAFLVSLVSEAMRWPALLSWNHASLPAADESLRGAIVRGARIDCAETLHLALTSAAPYHWSSTSLSHQGRVSQRLVGGAAQARVAAGERLGPSVACPRRRRLLLSM